MLYLEYDKITVKRFTEDDIQYKIKWINDSDNNKYLHYDLPLEYTKTLQWYNNIKNKTDRIDATIFYDQEPVGLIGLINIDFRNKKAEYYICLGNKNVKGQGIATIASKLFLNYSFKTLKLNKVYLYTEFENKAAQALFDRLNFRKEGLLKEDLIYCGRVVDRYIYGLTEKEAIYDI